MSQGRNTSIPEAVLSAFLGLLPVGIALGVLYGLEAVSVLALDLVVFGGLVVFVPWAVLKLDPRGLADFGDWPGP